MKNFNKSNKFIFITLLFTLFIQICYAGINFDNAIKAYKEKKYSEAIVLFNKAKDEILTEKENFDLLFFTFKIYSFEGDYINAVKQIKLIINKYNDKKESQEYKNAIANLEKMKILLINKASFLIDNKNSDEAILYCKYFIEQFSGDKNESIAKSLLANIYFLTKDFDRTINYLVNNNYDNDIPLYYISFPDKYKEQLINSMYKKAKDFFNQKSYFQASKFLEFIVIKATDEEVLKEAKSLLNECRDELQKELKNNSNEKVIT